METMIKRLIPVVLLILVVIAGCSRKPDEELPARVGDLQVLCKIVDQANLPETFPVTVSVYSDVARTLLADTKTITTMKDSVNTVAFTNLPSNFMYVHITVDVPSLSSRSRETDLTVYVKLDGLTVTPIQVLTVRPGYGDLQVLCKIVDQANLPERFPVTVSVYSDTARTLLAGTRTFTTMKESVDTVAFTSLPVSFMYVHITVNVDSLASTSCETDLTVYIKLERLTVTPIRVLTVHPGYIECSDL